MNRSPVSMMWRGAASRKFACSAGWVVARRPSDNLANPMHVGPKVETRDPDMKIAVIGAGGVGGTFGAALAKAGADVWFLARGAHLEAMRTNGLRITGGRGETHIVPTQATGDPAEIGPVDFVLFCV